jgi:hypothetical protein
MGKTVMGAVVSLDGFIADDNDGVGPLRTAAVRPDQRLERQAGCRRARLRRHPSATSAAEAQLTLPARVVVRVYVAQRNPVASGRGASGLAGRPPAGSSSL